MRQLRYTPRAQSDVIEIVEYIRNTIEDLDQALAFGDRIYDQCERIALLPGALGRPRDELGVGLRTFPFQSYVIVFRYVGEDSVEIARVLHAKRDLQALLGDPTA